MVSQAKRRQWLQYWLRKQLTSYDGLVSIEWLSFLIG